MGLVGDKLQGWVTNKSNQSINQTQCIKGTEAPLCFHRQNMQPQEVRLLDCVHDPQLAGQEEKMKSFLKFQCIISLR